MMIINICSQVIFVNIYIKNQLLNIILQIMLPALTDGALTAKNKLENLLEEETRLMPNLIRLQLLNMF